MVQIDVVFTTFYQSKVVNPPEKNNVWYFKCTYMTDIVRITANQRIIVFVSAGSQR